MPVVLLSHHRLGEDGPHRAILEQAGFQLRLPPPGTNLFDEAELGRALEGCDAVIAATEPYTATVFDRAGQLRVIARMGVGYDSIDIEAADAHRVAVTITPGTNDQSVAEHALAMLLAIARGFPERDRQVRRGGPWSRAALPRLAGRTLGLVGLGRIGKALAGRAKGLGLQLLAHEPYPEHDFVAQWGIELVGLHELLRRSDLVSLHLPLTHETRGLINGARLEMLKPGSMLVNTARGGLVVEADLVAALRSGSLAAAALDVFEEEPLPTDSPLLQLDNVLLSPHIAGLDEESSRDAKMMGAQILADLSQGRWRPDCVVNLKGVDDWKW